MLVLKRTKTTRKRKPSHELKQKPGDFDFEHFLEA